MALLLPLTAHAERLDDIKRKGVLTCGVSDNEPGLGAKDARGRYTGFEPDLCRAIAAAIFGSAGHAAFRPAATVDAFLKDSSIDLVVRGLTWTFGREMRPSLRFGPVVLHDGQTFLTRKAPNVERIAQLSGETICVPSDAEFLPNLRYYFRVHRLTLKAALFATRGQAEDAFFAGRCAALAADATELASAVIAKAQQSENFVILAEQISREPLAPLLRRGDERFFDAVRWAIFALIDAEELGISAANAEAMTKSDDPDIRRFFAASGSIFAPGWTAATVKAGGNFGELYARHLGAGSKAKLPRGLNRLPRDGGVLTAPPVR